MRNFNLIEWDNLFTREEQLINSINSWKALVAQYPNNTRNVDFLFSREQELQQLYRDNPRLKRTKI